MAALATTQQDDKPDSEEEDFIVQPVCTSSPVRGDVVDHRLVRQKAAQFLREAERNRKQIEKLERERTLSLQCNRNGWKDLSAELEEYEKVLNLGRHAEKLNLQKQLEKINNGVRKFQRQLIDVKPTPQLIERLKEIMSEVEISINTLKEEQRSCYEEFVKEERACRLEITAYEKKIETWSLAIKPNPRVAAAPSVKTTLLDRDLPAEVKALEAFLMKTGGPNGGWDESDHQVFLKVWTKHSGQPAYRKEAKLYLPGKTAEEMEQHEEWQQELLHLQARKREAIQRWKASKNKERLNRKQGQEEEEEAQRRERETKNQVLRHRTEDEKRELEWQLEVWREEKKRREEEEERLKLAEDIQKRRREKEERRRQLEVKLTLEEQLRLKREEEEEQERRRKEEEQREMAERRQEAAKSIKHFSERDLIKVEAKVHEKLQREKEEEERQRRITARLREKVDGQVNRDPSRLTRPTKGWEERMKHIGPSGKGPATQMFHRAIPTWRQGL